MKIRQITNIDYPNVALFLEKSTNGLITSNNWIERFNLWWENNPSHKSCELFGWIIEDNDTICGFIGTIPYIFILNNKSTKGISLTSWYVNQNHKNNSLLLLQKALKAIPEECLILNTTPSILAKKIFTGLGFKQFNNQWQEKTFILPLQLGQFSKIIIDRKFPRLKLFTIFFQITGKIIQTGFNLFIRFSKLPNMYQIEEIEEFSTEFDQFMEQLPNNHKTISIRNSITMNYLHFSLSDFQKYRKAFYLKNNGKIVSFFSVNIVQNPISNYIIPIDLFTLDNSKIVVESIIQQLIKLGRHHKVNYIRIDPFSPIFEKYLLLPRFIPIKIKHDFLYKNVKLENFNCDDFYLSLIDGDRGHFIH